MEHLPPEPTSAPGDNPTTSSSDAPGWLLDPVAQPKRLQAWIIEVERAHQDEAAAALLDAPDLEQLMQAWTPEEEQQLKSSPLPDPTQDVSAATFARLCCNVVGVRGSRPGHAGLVEALHTLFSLYLEFKLNPAFHGTGHMF